MVHRDIKPSNVLLDGYGKIKLADFGIASIASASGDPQLTSLTMQLGTPDYMAPEQRVNVSNVDQRADVYSLGVMLYEMLCGELPLGAFPNPSEVSSEYSEHWDKLVRDALNPNVDQRIQSAAEFLSRLRRIDVEGSQASITPQAAGISRAGRVTPAREMTQSSVMESPIQQPPQQSGDANKTVGTYILAMVVVAVLCFTLFGLWSTSKPDDANVYYEAGAVHSRKGDFHEAIKEFSKTIQLKPDYANAYASRGFTYKEKGDFFRAIQEYSKAIRIDPRKEFYESRAGVYRKIGLNAEAPSDINKAKQLAK